MCYKWHYGAAILIAFGVGFILSALLSSAAARLIIGLILSSIGLLLLKQQ